MVARAAVFNLSIPSLQLSIPPVYSICWLRRSAPDTHQDQASGDAAAFALAAFAAPEKRWCCTVSNELITDPWLPVFWRQSLAGSCCGRSASLANR